MFNPFNGDLGGVNNNLSKITQLLNNINFLEDIHSNTAIKIVGNNDNYFIIKKNGNKYKLETSFSDIDININYEASLVRNVIKNKVKEGKFFNFKKENIIIKKEIYDFEEFDITDSDSTFDLNYLSNLTDCVKFDNEEIEKYKLYSFNPGYDDNVNSVLKEYIGNLKEIFNNPKNKEVFLSEKTYISKYAFEEHEKDMNVKEKILSDLIKYFDLVLEEILKNDKIEHKNKTKTPVNIIIPNDSGIGIYNIKLSNFFEVYSSILKIGIIDKDYNIEIPKDTILVFSVYDFFRVIYTKNIVTNKLLLLIIRKPTVRILDRREIDFICYENNKLYICDSKLRTSYMKFKVNKDGKVIEDEYNKIYDTFVIYKDILLSNLKLDLNSSFIKNLDFYKTNNDINRKELMDFALLVRDEDIERELKFREKLNILIKQISDNDKLFGGFKLEVGNLQNKIGNNNKFKITTDLKTEKFEIEDVLKGFIKLNYSFNGK